MTAGIVPSIVSMSSRERHWDGVVLQHIQLQTGEFSLPSTQDDLLVVYLGGQTHVEARHDGGRLERRWSDRGHVSIKPAAQSLWRSLKGQCEALAVYISPALVQEVAEAAYGPSSQSLTLLSCFVEPDHAIEQLGRLLLAEAKREDVGTALAADLLVRSLAMQMLRRHSNLTPPTLRKPAGLPAKRLQRVMEYVQANMSMSLTLGELASVCDLSSSHFARAFRQETGSTPHRYVTRVRMERARELLENTKLSVPDVGMACGYEQATHFATMFKKLVGATPREWRLACR